MKMYQNRQKIKNKKLLMLACAGIGLCLVASGVIFYFLQHKTSVDPNSVRNEVTQHESPRNNNPVTKPNSNAGLGDSATSDQVPVAQGAVAKIVEIQQQGTAVTFSGTATNIAGGGKCVITLTNPNDRPITKEFDGMLSDGTVSCKTTIPAMEFSYLGTWQVQFRYYVNSVQATDNGTVTIQ